MQIRSSVCLILVIKTNSKLFTVWSDLDFALLRNWIEPRVKVTGHKCNGSFIWHVVGSHAVAIETGAFDEAAVDCLNHTVQLIDDVNTVALLEFFEF